jgi:PKD repeat protein
MNNIYTVIFFLLALTCTAQTTIVLQPGPEGKDAQIWTINPNNNYGNSPAFKVFGWTHSGVTGINRGLIDFDLAGLPENAEILDARLNLYFVCLEPTYFGHTGNNESVLQLIIQPWEENMVTWNNQPAVTTTDQVFLPQSTDPYQDYLDIDVTAAINRMFAQPDAYFGFMMRLQDENPYNCLMFASSDYLDTVEFRPKLVITYIACEPLTVGFSYEPEEQNVSFISNSPTAISWNWDFGDGYFASIQNPVHLYQQPGFYNVCLTVEDSCGTALQHCETIDVCDESVAGYIFDSEELMVSFTDTSHFSDEFFWDFGDGYYSDLQHPWHTYDTSGNYQVCLRAWNDCSADTVCQIVSVELSGLADQYEKAVSVYPNPAKDKIFISGYIEGPVTISIISLQGKELFKKEMALSRNVYPIDLGGISSGFYCLRISWGKQSLSKKIVLF